MERGRERKGMYFHSYVVVRVVFPLSCKLRIESLRFLAGKEGAVYSLRSKLTTLWGSRCSFPCGFASTIIYCGLTHSGTRRDIPSPSSKRDILS